MKEWSHGICFIPGKVRYMVQVNCKMRYNLGKECEKLLTNCLLGTKKDTNEKETKATSTYEYIHEEK